MDQSSLFRPLTQQSIKDIEERIKIYKQNSGPVSEEDHNEGDPEAAAAPVPGGADHRAPAAAEGSSSAARKAAGLEFGPSEPNAKLVGGEKLPLKFLDKFDSKLCGKPLEEIDPHYWKDRSFVVIGQDKTIWRFSTTKALFLFTPLNIYRRIAMYILAHPLFSALVILTILVNCAFMAMSGSKELEKIDAVFKTEYVFTAVYTFEAVVKISARGFIIYPFTYLRDAWNWLDFGVIVLVYVTEFIEIEGNIAVLRTFRVFRALKTVAVIPGLKTIVGALMEAVRRLRDVMILTVFVLSIFALIGLQLYRGVLRNKCILDFPGANHTVLNITQDEWKANSDNYELVGGTFKICSTDAGSGGRCSQNYTCYNLGDNPNYGFTNFDDFPSALLCAFRLMTQDAWESLYQQILRSQGLMHMVFFVMVIFMGSFYLVNLILAIVAMSYDEQQRADRENEENDLAEQLALDQERQMRDDLAAAEADDDYDDDDIDVPKSKVSRSASQVSATPSYPTSQHFKDSEMISIYSEFMPPNSSGAAPPDGGLRGSIKSGILRRNRQNESLSLPGSPCTRRKRSSSGFRTSFLLPSGVPQTTSASSGVAAPAPPNRRQSSTRHSLNPNNNVVDIDFPYADESGTATPTSEMVHGAPLFLTFSKLFRRRPSAISKVASDSGLGAAEMDKVDTNAAATRNSTRRLTASYTDELSDSMASSKRRPPPTDRTTSRFSYSEDEWDEARPTEGGGSHSSSGGVIKPSFSYPKTPLLEQCLRRNADPLKVKGADGGGGGDVKNKVGPYTPPAVVVDPPGPAPPHPPSDPSDPSDPTVSQKPKPSLTISSVSELEYPATDDAEGVDDQFLTVKNRFKTPRNSVRSRTSRSTRRSARGSEDKRRRSVSIYSRRSSGAKPLSKKERTKAAFLRVRNICCAWDCHPWIVKPRRLAEWFILDAFTELFVTFCIILNTIFMAMDHHGMSDNLKDTLFYGNYVFTSIFTAEAALKIFALNPIGYFSETWNIFDSVVVLFSLIELMLEGEGAPSLSILRSFRLLRVFKLAKSWPTLNLLMTIIGKTLGALGNLTFVLAIIVFIFAVMGMQLFGQKYIDQKHVFPGQAIPRWNFTTFFHSFMIVFRVLCGEYIESMWDCQLVAGWPCVPFFLLTMIIGNLVILNLFLALLLSAFAGDTLSSQENEENKIAEAIDRIKRFVAYCKRKILRVLPLPVRTSDGGGRGPNPGDGDGVEDRYDHDEAVPMVAIYDNGKISTGGVERKGNHSGPAAVRPQEAPSNGSYTGCNNIKRPSTTDDCIVISNSISYNERPGPDTVTEQPRPIANSVPPTSGIQNARDGSLVLSNSIHRKDGYFLASEEDDMIFSTRRESLLTSSASRADPEEDEDAEITYERLPEDCCLPIIYRKIPCCATVAEKTAIGRAYWKYRCFMYKMVEHKYFETFIILMILASSMALAFEDIHLPNNPTLQMTLKIADKVFTVVFIIEMSIKWGAYGFKKYFTDVWCWLDFFIVTISIVGLAAESLNLGNMSAFRALRTLRALRPLRAVSRWEGMKVVVNSLFQAIPSIANVMMVCMVFWLIFSIMGVQFFSGKFYKCLDGNGNRLNASTIPNRTACNQSGYTWENSRINFDNAIGGYLALLQIATWKGWIQIMSDAVDATDVDQQPDYEVNIASYLYFVLFIIFGSFFTLNLFIGVIIENFNKQKKKAGSGSLEMFMTEDQRRYYNAMKKLGGKQPQKPIPRPKLKCQAFFFDLTSNQWFDIIIMVFIMLNMVAMCLEHYSQNEVWDEVLQNINYCFLGIFTLECVLKLLAQRWYYFRIPWNVFDFVVVALSIFSAGFGELIQNVFVSPTLFRVIRVFRIGRILRLVKSAKGIRTLLFSLAVSLPALFNIGLLLFLVMFIYSIFGMSFFMYVKHEHGLDDQFNFQTFGSSLTLLFQISTSAGWDGVLNALMNDQDGVNCDRNAYPNAVSPNGNCGNGPIAVAFLVSYLIISFLVVINMYIAVILENFSQATEDVQQGLTQDDFDMFYEIWEKFDPKATHYIKTSDLETFIDSLEEPLRIVKPNHFQVVNLAIPICSDERVNCVDILDSLTRNFLGTGEETEIPDELAPTSEKDKPNYVITSNTLIRQREHFCASVIQRAWLRHRKQDMKNIMVTLANNNSNSRRAAIFPDNNTPPGANIQILNSTKPPEPDK